MSRLHDKRAASSIDVNNLREFSFGTRIANQDVKSKRLLLGRSGSLEGFMSLILALVRKWVGWYRVLRYGKAFSFADSVRYGLWLARG